ncbi:MAG: SGNH/GDSL hydrolase family protein [Bryobacteraceae bacterium]
MGWLGRSTALLLLVAVPWVSVAATKKRRARRVHYPAPRVSAKARAAAAERVSKSLAARPEHPIERSGVMVPFFELLYRKTLGESQTLHILHFGDSHTAADAWTGRLRASLQQRFGDGGAGFSFPGRPFKGYRRFDVQAGGASQRWEAEGLRTGAGDGLFGLGGISISTERKDQSVFVEADCEYLEVFYLQQPGGGGIALYEDGQPAREISTAGELGPGYLTHQTSAGVHRFEIRTLDRAPVRLFGWVTEKAQGVTYESMGINGAEAVLILRWNEAMLASYIERRNPALIVLAYGTNEAGDPQWTLESYREMFGTLLERLRRAAPVASILVLGPPDRLRRAKGRWEPLDKLDTIIAAQKEASRRSGCAYWDTRARMGGKGSMRDWVYAELAQPDYVHFTSAGYRRLADALFQDIIQEFQTFIKYRTAPPEQVANGETSQNP